MRRNLYVPIGVECSVSHYLRSVGKRKEAYPFDWNVVPITSAIQLMANNFYGFLEKESLVFLPPTKRLLFNESGTDLIISNEIITPVICARYGILFPHDFSENGIADYLIIKEKYERRIQRLILALHKHSRPIFVYNDVCLNEWQLNQYKLAGIDFHHDIRERIFSDFSKLNIKGSKLISLNELRIYLKPLAFYRKVVRKINDI